MERDEDASIKPPPTLITLPPELISMILARRELSLEDLFYMRFLCKGVSRLAFEQLVGRLRATIEDPHKISAIIESLATDVEEHFSGRVGPIAEDQLLIPLVGPTFVGKLLRGAGFNKGLATLHWESLCVAIFKPLNTGADLGTFARVFKGPGGRLEKSELARFTSYMKHMAVIGMISLEPLPTYFTRELINFTEQWLPNGTVDERVEFILESVAAVEAPTFLERWLAVSSFEGWLAFFDKIRHEEKVMLWKLGLRDWGWTLFRNSPRFKPTEIDVQRFCNAIWPRIVTSAWDFGTSMKGRKELQEIRDGLHESFAVVAVLPKLDGVNASTVEA